MAERKATGITGPAYQLFSPDALEQALVTADIANSGVFAPVTGHFALRDARENSAAMRQQYSSGLADANMKALMNSLAEMANEREINRVKVIGSIAEKDPYGVPSMYRTGDAGLTHGGGSVEEVAAAFAKLAGAARAASAYKDAGDAARNLTEAGRQPDLNPFNAFLKTFGGPPSLDTVQTSILAGAASNPTKNTITRKTPLAGGVEQTETQVTSGAPTVEQNTQTIRGQGQSVGQASGQGRPLTAGEMTAWRGLIKSQLPNATIDPAYHISPEGIQYVLVRDGNNLYGYRKVGNKTARIQLQ